MEGVSEDCFDGAAADKAPGAPVLPCLFAGAAACSEQGAKRKANQDNYCLHECGAAVFDGIGGLPAGDVCSGFASQEFARLLEKQADASAAEVLLALDESMSQLKNGGGVAACLLLCSPEGPLHLAAAGDVLALGITVEGQPRRLNQLHHIGRGPLTSWVGSGYLDQMRTYTATLNPADYAAIMLLSDGVYGYVEAEEICALWQEAEDPAGFARLLVARALQNESPDDRTALVLVPR